jgi:glycerol uptake facilitator protein
MWRGLSTALRSRHGAAALCGGGSALCLYASSRTNSLCEGKAKVPACPAKLVAPSAAETTSGPTMEQRLMAEAFGTGLIVQFGCGAVCALKYANAPFNTFGIAAAWGIGVTLAVYATRAVSGAHLNPAVTAALVSIDAFPAEEAPLYVAAQMAGATVAASVNYMVFSAGIAASEAAASIVRGTAASTASFAGAFGMVPSAAITGAIGAFAAEVWMTSILLFVILAVGDKDHGSVPEAAAPVLVGSTVAGLICTFGPVTGCGMNPARDLGPRLVTLFTGWGGAALTAGWVYTLGPLVGACLGAYAYKHTLASEVTRK